MRNAAGIVVDLGLRQGWVESSLSTTAALAGGAPLLVPVSGSVQSNVGDWMRHLGGAPLHNIYRLPDLLDFVSAATLLARPIL